MRAPLIFLAFVPAFFGQEYFESFDAPGKPAERQGITWQYQAELAPADWLEVIPGDGYAHLSVDSSSLKNRSHHREHWPFQALTLEPVRLDTRISIRAKNAAIPGVAGLLFTYQEKESIQEIDIEIAAADIGKPFTPHPTDSGSGWTDVRLNTWVNAAPRSPVPTRSIRAPIKDARGEKISHQDGSFHVYTIEWRAAGVRFFIDNVFQAATDSAPKSPATVIFGLRQTPWSGNSEWSGRQTMLVDWIDLEPLE